MMKRSNPNKSGRAYALSEFYQNTDFSTFDKKEREVFVISNKKYNPELVICNSIGLGGTVWLAREKEAELRKRLPGHFIQSAQSLYQQMEKTKMAREALQTYTRAVYPILDGGAYAALWRVAQDFRAGFLVFLKEIPILQETIEISEALGLNPYRLFSGGSYLAVSDAGQELAWACKEMGIPCKVVGKLVKGLDKHIDNGSGIRCLNRPSGDEIDKFITPKEGKER